MVRPKWKITILSLTTMFVSTACGDLIVWSWGFAYFVVFILAVIGMAVAGTMICWDWIKERIRKWLGLSQPKED